jgi:hypothetical protein
VLNSTVFLATGNSQAARVGGTGSSAGRSVRCR